METITVHTFKDWKLVMNKWLSDNNNAAFSDTIEVDKEIVDDIMTCDIAEVQDKIYKLLYWKFRT